MRLRLEEDNTKRAEKRREHLLVKNIFTVALNMSFGKDALGWHGALVSAEAECTLPNVFHVKDT